MKIHYIALLIFSFQTLASISPEEVLQRGDVKETLRSHYGYESVELATIDILFPNHIYTDTATLYFVLCKQSVCHFVKVASSKTTSFDQFSEAIALQNRAAEEGLSIPVLRYGTIVNPSFPPRYFMISVAVETDLNKCAEGERDRQYFVRELLKLNIIHADLWWHLNNIACHNGKRVVLDFDESWNLVDLADVVRERLIALEKKCTFNMVDDSKEDEIVVELRSSAKSAAGTPGMFPLCWCRLKNLPRQFKPPFDCSLIIERLLSN